MSDPTAGGRTPRTMIRVTAAEKAAKALRMRAMRASYEEIAKECGYSNRGTAYAAVQKALKAIPYEAVRELRSAELESLDLAEKAIATRVLRGELAAIDRWLKIKQERAKLTGLYEEIADTGVDEVKLVLRAWISGVRDEVAKAQPDTLAPTEGDEDARP